MQPLHDDRNRKRELALQTPRLSATPAWPGGQTGTSHARAAPSLVMALRDARGGPPIRYGYKPVPMPVRGPFSVPIRGPDWLFRCLPEPRNRGNNGIVIW